MLNPRAVLAALLLSCPVHTSAEDAMITLPLSELGRWTYVSDKVMGGVSEGAARVTTDNGASVLHLTGDVSTANNGGFIQTRAKLDTPLPATITGVVIEARGNAQRYFVHLRTTGTALPWQYYQAPFETTQNWREIRLPLSAFKPSGRLLRGMPRADAIRSVGIVAYGRPHKADVSVRLVGFY